MDDWEEKINEEPRFEMPTNKWEGEDEDEEVLDSWEDMNEEKKDVEKPPEVPKAKSKPKNKLAEKIEERERKAREEAERRAQEKEEAMTPEERRAEMLRRKELVEQSDLRVTMDTFGVDKAGINGMFPTNPEEFKDFHDALFQKISQFNKHVDYPAFAEDLIKSISITLNATSLRKVKTTVESLHSEKLKMEKEKVKKNKGKGKAKLKVEGESEYGDLAAYDANDYDDFM